MIKTGTVAWFDGEEGMIYCTEDDCSYYVYHDAILSNDETKTLLKGSKVEFTLYTNLYMSQVDTITIVK